MNLTLTPAEVATIASAISEAIGVCVDELVAHGDEDAAYARTLHARMDQFSALARKIKLAQEVQT